VNDFVFEARIAPNAPKNRVEQTDTGWKIRIHAPPVDGKANEALVRFLAKEVFGLPLSGVELIRGETGRQKTFRVSISSEMGLLALQRAAEKR